MKIFGRPLEDYPHCPPIELEDAMKMINRRAGEELFYFPEELLSTYISLAEKGYVAICQNDDGSFLILPMPDE